MECLFGISHHEITRRRAKNDAACALSGRIFHTAEFALHEAVHAPMVTTQPLGHLPKGQGDVVITLRIRKHTEPFWS